LKQKHQHEAYQALLDFARNNPYLRDVLRTLTKKQWKALLKPDFRVNLTNIIGYMNNLNGAPFDMNIVNAAIDQYRQKANAASRASKQKAYAAAAAAAAAAAPAAAAAAAAVDNVDPDHDADAAAFFG
jgi:mevalonate pyrophosphate decarboxylase